MGQLKVLCSYTVFVLCLIFLINCPCAPGSQCIMYLVIAAVNPCVNPGVFPSLLQLRLKYKTRNAYIQRFYKFSIFLSSLRSITGYPLCFCLIEFYLHYKALPYKKNARNLQASRWQHQPLSDTKITTNQKLSSVSSALIIVVI